MQNTLPNNYKLNARYTILHQIGQGGFGITYKAFDSLTDQYVCIKELFISGHNSREGSLHVRSQSSTEQFDFTYFKRKFLEEGKRLAQFNHPNIVKVIDFFEDYNTAYLIMEFIEGESLKHFVERYKRLNQKQALFLTNQLLTAVKEIHKKDILHRDIKPDNIIIKSNNELVLIDFGLAKVQDRNSDITSTLVMLSHGYAPPEQYSKEGKKGPYTDIYAIGATIYFMLTGEKPIQSTNRIMDKLHPIRDYNKEVDDLIIKTVAKCMELKSSDRFQDINQIQKRIVPEDQIKHSKSEVNKINLVKHKFFNSKVWKTVKGSFKNQIFLFLDRLILLLTTGFSALGIAGLIEKQFDFSDYIVNFWILSIVVIMYIFRDKYIFFRLPIIVKVILIAFPLIALPISESFKQSNKKDRAKEPLTNSPILPKEFTLSEESNNFTDLRDRKTYKSVKIGNQTWMAENLAYKPTSGNYWAYDNDLSNIAKYGYLYDWETACKVCPNGWHLPSDAEWTRLTDYLGGENLAGTKMKSSSGWRANGNGSNASGFSGLPGGYRINDGTFGGIGVVGFWWSSTEDDSVDAWDRGLGYDGGYVNRDNGNKEDGCSVRCLRD